MRLLNLLRMSTIHIVPISLLCLSLAILTLDLAMIVKSASEQHILFFSDRDGADWRMYSMKPDGTDVQHVATHPNAGDIGFWYGADLSPDGQSLAYVEQICTGEEVGFWCFYLYLMDITTGEVEKLTDGGEDYNPIWSPNGQYLAYYSRLEFAYVAVVEVSTGELILNLGESFLSRLQGGQITGLAWSSDSQELVISVSNPPDGGETLYLVSLSGEEERISETLEGRWPGWQVDSDIIYYGCISGLSHICRIDLATRNWEQVPGLLPQLEVLGFDLAISNRFDINFEGILLFDLSYYMGDSSTLNQDIYLYDTNTNTLTNLTENAEYNSYYPRWHTVPSVGAPPVADAGADQSLTADPSGFATVTLDGSASFDPDGEIVSYVWKLDGVEIATGAMAQVQLGVGEHVITLTVTDNDGAVGVDSVVVTVLPFSGLMWCCTQEQLVIPQKLSRPLASGKPPIPAEKGTRGVRNAESPLQIPE